MIALYGFVITVLGVLSAALLLPWIIGIAVPVLVVLGALLAATLGLVRLAIGSKKFDSIAHQLIGKWKTPQINILLVDDQPFSAEFIMRCFAKKGCSTKVSSLPEEAVSMITPKTVDLLVLDWQMPGMNGDDVLAAADKMISDLAGSDAEPKAKIPVLVYSGAKQEQIKFPATKNFVSLGIMSKAEDLRDLLQKTNLIINQLPAMARA